MIGREQEGGVGRRGNGRADQFIVDALIGREDAARCYHQIPERLGDMVVLGDRHTMFGDLDSAHEKLGSSYRAHGSNYEMDLPLIVFNWQEKLPGPERFQKNKDLAHFIATGA